MNEIYKANPDVTMNSEHEEWAVLTNSVTGESCGLSPIAAFIWEKIDGIRSKRDILNELEKVVIGELPPEASEDFDQFTQPLISKGWLTTKD